MFVPTTGFTLTLPCKDCHRPVKDSESNGYRLIVGVLYGWCNECFNEHQRRLKRDSPALASGDLNGANEPACPGPNRSRN
jgi:hypothetical protein